MISLSVTTIPTAKGEYHWNDSLYNSKVSLQKLQNTWKIH